MAAVLVAVAFAYAVAARDHALVALFAPALLGSAVLCARFPAAMTTLVLLMSGTYGSVQAFGGPSLGPGVDLIIFGGWAALLITHLVGVRERPWWVWPGVVLLLAYLGLTLIEIGTASSVALGFKAFRYSALYMTVAPLLALAGWRLRTYLDISKGIVLVTSLVSGYAVLRLIIGPAAKEASYALFSAGPYTTVGGQLSLIGSLPSRHALAFWVACAAPVCLAVALMDKRLRKTAAIAVGLCVAAVYGTDVRTALAAVAAGGATVVVLYQLSAGTSGRAVTQTLTALAIAGLGGVLLFSTVVGSNSGRYNAILNPSGDLSWEQHLTKWEQALRDLKGEPFGKGLGTGGRLAQQGDTGIDTIATYNLDSSYLKIAYEQGIPILVFFVLSLIAVLVGLARRTARARSPGARALGAGAAGALVTGMVMFFTGLYIEDLVALALWVPLGAAIGALVAERSEGPEPAEASGTV
jgi:O-antigen ligase/polysaccharide polymerase Wzy-like membrane protein